MFKKLKQYKINKAHKKALEINALIDHKRTRIERIRQLMINQMCPFQGTNSNCKMECIHFKEGGVFIAWFMGDLMVESNQPACRLWGMRVNICNR